MLKPKFVYLFVILSLILVKTTLYATQTTYTFYPIADTFIKNNAKNENEGLATNLRIQHPDHYGHVLLKFSQADILNTIGTNHVVSANLKLYIETNFNNWGSGATIDVHRINADWEERITTNPAQGVTWNCYPADTNLGNGVPNCDEEWEGGFYEDYISASSLHQNSQTGWKSYSVTSDVQLFQKGLDHYGWLLKKRDYSANGSVDYTSIQGTAAFKPRLEVTIDDQTTCSPSNIETITPAVIVSNGTNQTITVSGQGLDRITDVLVDGSSISYTIVNSTTLTFIRNYSTPGLHTLMFRSNCLESPLDVYEFEAAFEFAGHGVEIEACTNCSLPGVTYFSRNGDRLCFNRCFTRLIGYGGDFFQITWNFKWNTDTDADAINDASTIIEDYMKRAQFKTGTGNNNIRGINFNRQFAIGGGCNDTAGPANCKGYPEDNNGNAQSELMPFRISAGKYDILNLKNDGSNLDKNWKKRFKNYIKYADKNGIAVMISLFDENNMTGAGPWPNNPWNRDNSNHGCSQLPTGENTAFPYFYKICSDYTNATTCNSTLNCLGLRERAYVKAIVSMVKSNKKCGSAGITRCKNVIFEIMNEAVFDEGWSSSDLTIGQFKTWHATVASWIKSLGTGYIVSANVKEKAGQPYPCNPNDDVDEYCRLQACGTSSCPNYFNALFAGGVDIFSLHWGAWQGDICGKDEEALQLGKPVIFDDDGGCGPGCSPHPRDNNTFVRNWALNVSESEVCAGEGPKNKGELHFYHTGDGSKLEGSSPSTCSWSDVRWVDCQVWNGIADGLPDKYCGTGLTPCASRVNYCENGTSSCNFP